MTNTLNRNKKLSAAELAAMAKKLRRHVVAMIGAAGSGHPGGSLSAADIITCLYFSVLRHAPENPHWPDRDRFILSKGHAAPVLYSALAESGYLSVDLLPTLRKLGSCL
ncbi:transketolase, partial [bacterium]